MVAPNCVAHFMSSTARQTIDRARQLFRDEAGSIGIMFGLMVIPTIMLVGVAVDIGRMIMVRRVAWY